MARDIAQLHPELQNKIEELKSMCEKKGLKLGISECFRTVDEQDALYAKGRTAPGNKVTNAKGSTYSSQHQWGIAFDIFQNIKGKEYSDVSFFKEVAKMAKSIGLGWGGDWKSIVDMPHFYLPDWGSTTTALKKEYKTFENFKKTWGKSVVETDKKKSISKIAKEVIAGKWGSGASRKTALEKAGYNYEEVQKCVKQLMKVNVKTSPSYYQKYTGTSGKINEVLKEIGVDNAYIGSYKKRKPIAEKNGIKDYAGRAEQNTDLINLAKKGKLKRV